jgi:MinD superfamily P-loop ATPase
VSPLPTIDLERCTGCGKCVQACAPGAIVAAAGKVRLASPERCDYCMACEDVCPEGAIALPFVVVLRRRSNGDGGMQRLTPSGPWEET